MSLLLFNIMPRFVCMYTGNDGAWSLLVRIFLRHEKQIVTVHSGMFVCLLLWAGVQPTLDPSAETLCRSNPVS